MSRLSETVQGAVLQGALRLPRRLLARLAGEPVIIEGRRLDLHCQALLRLMATSGRRPPNELPVEQARAESDSFAPLLGPLTERPVHSFAEAAPGKAGPIRLRIYKPAAPPRPAPALIYYHGGGFVIGGLDSHDRVCRALAELARCLVIAVDYRLAPEHPFPAAVEDSLAAFRWARENAARLGADPLRLAVGGDSAGGNLATVVSRAMVTEGETPPCFQMLIYPTTDVSRRTRSYELFGRGFYLTSELMEWFVAAYAPDPEQRAHPDCSPLLAETLEGMPPAFVATAGFDPLVDEGVAYVERLREAGVSVLHRNYDSLIHAYLSMSGVIPEAARALEDAARALRRGFEQALSSSASGESSDGMPKAAAR